MSHHEALTAVREGMEVRDSEGERVGTVAEVKIADAGTVTSAGQHSDDGGLFTDIVRSITDRGLPEQERERLARLGYVRVDAAGLFQGDRFAAGDEIVRVEEETVHLGVPAARLVG